MRRLKKSLFKDADHEEEKTEYERERDARVKRIHDSEEFRNVLQAVSKM